MYERGGDCYPISASERIAIYNKESAKEGPCFRLIMTLFNLIRILKETNLAWKSKKTNVSPNGKIFGSRFYFLQALLKGGS